MACAHSHFACSQAHEDRNEARKLTPAERKEKKLAKLTGEVEDAVITQVSVFSLGSLANTQHQWKVRVNAEVTPLPPLHPTLALYWPG